MPDRSRRPDALKRQKQRDAQAKARKREDRCRALSLGLQIGEDGRAVASLPMRRRFLIVCEGSETEPLYFKALKRLWRLQADIKIEGGAGDPLCIVERAEDLRAKAKQRGKGEAGPYDEVWVVFDRDEFDPARIGDALTKARACGIRVAFSNEAFELWLLLHFRLQSTPRGRRELCNDLQKMIKGGYTKSDPELCEKLRPRMGTAVRHARRLEAEKEQEGPCEANPYTGVHKLVEALGRNGSVLPSVREEVESIFSSEVAKESGEASASSPARAKGRKRRAIS